MFLFQLQLEVFEVASQNSTEFKKAVNLLRPFQKVSSLNYTNSLNSANITSETTESLNNNGNSSSGSRDSIVFTNSKSFGILSESLNFLLNRLDLKNRPKDYRLGNLSIEIIRETNMDENEKDKSLKKETDEDLLLVASGYTELSYGILHLYRNKTQISNEEFSAMDLKIVCVLAVPAHLTPSEFLQFVVSYRKKISHYRILRDTQVNRYLVLMKFKQSSFAKNFYDTFNGKPFNSIEPEKCNVIFVSSIQFQSSSLPSYVFPAENETKSTEQGSSSKLSPSSKTSNKLKGKISYSQVTSTPSADKSSSPSPLDDKVELPTCPVCLERMDATVSGIMTTLCHHTFHCQCLSKWGENRCPVCRYSQFHPIGKGSTGNNEHSVSENECFVCQARENLWICLICGHIGCGRYLSAHAQAHFTETQHLYSMELETQRVWDYLGDGYVHRLIQNKDDGKLVELPPNDNNILSGFSSGSALSQEKMDALGLEFSFLLTSSLESQRMYYENLLEGMTKDLTFYQHKYHQLDQEYEEGIRNQSKLLTLNEMSETKIQEYTTRLDSLNKELERHTSDNLKLKKEVEIARKCLSEEQTISKSLQNNQKEYADKIQQLEIMIKEKDATILDLNEQISDLLVNLEMKDKVNEALANESTEEGKRAILEGSVGAQHKPGEASSSNTKKRKYPKYGRRK